MNEKIRCQSCGMPLGMTDGKSNVSEIKEFCMFCVKNGKFTEPNLTMEGMIEKSVHFMTTRLGFTRQRAEEMSRSVIPGLKRWRK